MTFTSSTPSICVTSGTNGSTVTLQAVGTCSIVASQAGNANYAAASAVTQSFSIVADAAPSVSITAPTSGQGFNAPASVTFTANATSSDATITQVQYFNGSALIGTATQAPYSVTWGSVAQGSYSITAVATDNLGTSTTSAPLALTVNSPVIVNLTSPGAGQSFNGGSPIQLTATATDSQGTITQVSFYDGSNLLATMTQAPYGITISDLAEGTHSLTARATDSNAQTGTSQGVSITVVSSGGSGNGQVAYDIDSDQLGTPRLITDQGGNVVWQWDNDDPFGNNMPNQSPSGGNSFVFNLRFPGQYYDIETGNHYNYFRDYDPRLGQFIESDPIGLVGGGFSTYAYVGGSPLRYFDPSGLIYPGEPSNQAAIESAIARGDARALAQMLENGNLSEAEEALAQRGLSTLAEQTARVRSFSNLIPDRFKGKYVCDKFAKALRELMKKNKIRGKRIEIRSSARGGIDSLKNGNISTNGYHEAVQVGDTIFDNMNPEGVPADVWQNDIGISDPSFSQYFTETVTDF